MAQDAWEGRFAGTKGVSVHVMDLNRVAGEDPSRAQERPPDCSLGKGLQACLEYTITLAFAVAGTCR